MDAESLPFCSLVWGGKGECMGFLFGGVASCSHVSAAVEVQWVFEVFILKLCELWHWNVCI